MQPFKPNHKYQVPEEPFSTNTVYDLSYRPFGADTARGCRPELATVKGNIQTPCETLANDTVTSLSYVYNYQPPAEPFRPLHKPLPCAPLTQMTTNRHDFPPKPVSRTEPIKLHGNFSPICSKMDGSYLYFLLIFYILFKPMTFSYSKLCLFQIKLLPWLRLCRWILAAPHAASNLCTSTRSQRYPWMGKRSPRKVSCVPGLLCARFQLGFPTGVLFPLIRPWKTTLFTTEVINLQAFSSRVTVLPSKWL